MMMIKASCTLLLVALLVLQASASLKISSKIPQLLQNRYKDYNSVSYHLLNTGKIPFVPAIAGHLTYVAAEDYFCDLSDTRTYEVYHTFVMFHNSPRCSLTSQVLLAQSLGAKVAIVYGCQLGEDNLQELPEYRFIPTLCVQQREADLLQLLNQYTDDPVFMELTVNIVRHQKLTMFVYIDNILDLAAATLHKFSRLRDPFFNGRVTARPVYNIYESAYCDQKSCLDGDRQPCKYCADDPDTETQPADGKQAVEEYVRQLCIYQELGEI
jgi:hypothetical protein